MTMERKIGEIFEYNGEWYQCVESSDGSCRNCNMNFGGKCPIPIKECTESGRSDKKYVISKKLEKVGEPIELASGMFFQRMLIYNNPIYNGEKRLFFNSPHETFMYLELNQNQEDMEEKEIIEKLSEKVHNAWMKEKKLQGFTYGEKYDDVNKKHPDLLPYEALKEEVKEYDRVTVRAVLKAQKELQQERNTKLSLKSFDLEAAKVGKPVCTRDGRKARIICFDRNDNTPIVALIECVNHVVILQCYHNDGKVCHEAVSQYDLMMLPEKKEGWVNIYNDGGTYYSKYIYKTEKEATGQADTISPNHVATVKIDWDE